jgi:hypothetical protein
MSIHLFLFGIFILLANISMSYFLYNIIIKRLDTKDSDIKDDDIRIKIELLREQIKLSTIIIQNNSILISNNKKDLDTFEAFIKAAMITVNEETIH